MTKLESLKVLYEALGGTAEDVAEMETITDVLNAISELYEGETADTISEAIENLVLVAKGISPGQATLITKTIEANGTYAASADNADGYTSVTVDVEADLQDKTVTPTTETQTVTADQDKDGLGTVTVNAVTAAIDENIVAGNIKAGVTILGIEGTYTGE